MTSTELEGTPKSKEQPFGNNSECHLESIEIGCTRKLSSPGIFNENRLDIDTLKKLSNTSGCLESTAIDSVVVGGAVEDVKEPVDGMKRVGKEYASDNVRSLVTGLTSTGSKVNQADTTTGNLNENTKTDEDSTEELETDEISLPSDAKENHNSSEKADKTLDFVSKPMVEGMTVRPNDWTAIRILSMETDASSSNGKDVGTVESSESVMTDVFDFIWL